MRAAGNCISASGMRFKNGAWLRAKGQRAKAKHWAASAFFIATLVLFLPAAYCHARVIEGVAAFVDDAAITFGELNENYEKAKKAKPDTAKEEILSTMINRLLLINEVKKMKIEAKTDEDMLNEYIDLKIRSVIRISEADMEDFYNKNPSEFKDASFETVRGRIESYLTELEINKKLKKQIEDLKAKAYVKIIRE